MSDMVNAKPQVSALTARDLHELMQPTQGPCVSIYIETGAGVNADQGRIRFKDALKEVEASLGQHKDPGQAGGLLEPLRALESDTHLWLSSAEGARSLAVFLSADKFWLRKLPKAVERDAAIVADSFHVKPLIRIMGDAGRYQLLCVSSERVALYQGIGTLLQEIELHPNVPRDMGAALGEPARVTKTKGDAFAPADSDERDRQLTRYFRRIDEAVGEHHSRPSGLPLILAALKEYHGFFREASHNLKLVDKGVKRDPFKGISVSELGELGELAWQAMQPAREKRLADLRQKYGNAAAHEQAFDDVNEVARQAVFGKVATLMVRENHRVGGSLDRGTGEITFKAIGDPRIDDVLDDVAETVVHNGGEVLILPEAQMPTDTGIAAVLRY